MMDTTMKQLITAVILSLLTMIVIGCCFKVQAECWHCDDDPQPVTNNYITNEYVTTSTIDSDYSYEADKCQGVPMAMAVGNNQMYMGTNKPQASIGFGECDGKLAGSAMFGVKPCPNCPLINGNWAFDDNDVNAFGLGATFIFK